MANEYVDRQPENQNPSLFDASQQPGYKGGQMEYVYEPHRPEPLDQPEALIASAVDIRERARLLEIPLGHFAAASQYEGLKKAKYTNEWPRIKQGIQSRKRNDMSTLDGIKFNQPGDEGSKNFILGSL